MLRLSGCLVCSFSEKKHISFQDIPLINRVQIIDDAFNLARSGLLRLLSDMEKVNNISFCVFLSGQRW